MGKLIKGFIFAACITLLIGGTTWAAETITITPATHEASCHGVEIWALSSTEAQNNYRTIHRQIMFNLQLNGLDIASVEAKVGVYGSSSTAVSLLKDTDYPSDPTRYFVLMPFSKIDLGNPDKIYYWYICDKATGNIKSTIYYAKLKPGVYLKSPGNKSGSNENPTTLPTTTATLTWEVLAPLPTDAAKFGVRFGYKLKTEPDSAWKTNTAAILEGTSARKFTFYMPGNMLTRGISPDQLDQYIYLWSVQTLKADGNPTADNYYAKDPSPLYFYVPNAPITVTPATHEASCHGDEQWGLSTIEVAAKNCTVHRKIMFNLQLNGLTIADVHANVGRWGSSTVTVPLIKDTDYPSDPTRYFVLIPFTKIDLADPNKVYYWYVAKNSDTTVQSIIYYAKLKPGVYLKSPGNKSGSNENPTILPTTTATLTWEVLNPLPTGAAKFGVKFGYKLKTDPDSGWITDNAAILEGTSARNYPFNVASYMQKKNISPADLDDYIYLWSVQTLKADGNPTADNYYAKDPSPLYFYVPSGEAISTPEVTGINTSASVDDHIIIAGKGFTETGTIEVGGKLISDSDINTWEDSRIIIKVPFFDEPGVTSVEVTNKYNNSAVTSFILRPRIITLDKFSGKAGDKVLISGTAFGANQGVVTFGGIEVTTFESWTSVSIEAYVPEGAQTGPVMIRANEADSNDNIIFTVSDRPNNQAPTLEPIGSKTVRVGQILTIQLIASDPDGDPLTYHASSLPSDAYFDEGAGVFEWTPQSVGECNITFTVDDGFGGSASETVNIRVFDIYPPVIHTPPCYPNPFNPLKTSQSGVKITYFIEQNEQKDVGVYIYNVMGQLVYKKINLQQTGHNETLWDGKNLYSEIVSEGVYIVLIVDEQNKKVLGKTKILVVKK